MGVAITMSGPVISKYSLQVVEVPLEDVEVCPGSMQRLSYNVLSYLVLLLKLKYPQNFPHYIILNVGPVAQSV